MGAETWQRLLWVILIGLLLTTQLLGEKGDWFIAYPEGWVVPLTPMLNSAMNWFTQWTGWFFRGLSDILAVPVSGVQQFLQWLPWPVVMVLTAAASWAAAGWKLALFSTLALLYMVVVGYWPESMNSLSLVILSVPLAVAVGFMFGVWGFRSGRAEKIIMPMLDMLQTIPAFAYLLPILLLFGFGPVVGLIASILFAFPPMVRNTMLGLRRVSAEVIESGLMSGATPRQLFWQVRIPSASHQLLLGANQTTMAAVSMVIIASIIGGTADIGWEVLLRIRKAQFGESILAGIVIALLAMVIDRITYGFAGEDDRESAAEEGFLRRHRYLVIGVVGAILAFLLSNVVPAFREWPRAWVIYPADAMNQWLENLILNWSDVIGALKTVAFYYIMLPVRVGLVDTISPYSWGFEFTQPLRLGYAALVMALGAWAWFRGRVRLALAILFMGVLLYFGLTKLSWLVLVAMASALGFQLGGRKLATGTLLALLSLVLVGVWPQAMLSVYLCGIAVIISFIVGGLIGITASEVPMVSRIVRPINDTLQTMPLFVILIPFVMLFKIGEFSALLAVVAYAIVPSIRYTEHGLRNLPADVIEASTSMGCTRWQLLTQVKLPLALPVIMLGLNQTIMYAIAMLVIAALVGTNGLGQQVYIGLGDGDFGVGIIAGIGMAIIAMVADRFTQGWNAKRQAAYS